METKNKKKKITSKSLRVYAIIFLVVGAVYILSGIYSFFTTVNGYISQGYATSEVLTYLLPSQFLPTVVEPLAIFGGFALLLFGISEVLSRLGSENNDIVNENDVTEEALETEVIEDVQEEAKDEEVNVSEDVSDNEEVIETDVLEEDAETTDKGTEDDVTDDATAEDEKSEEDAAETEVEIIEKAGEEDKEVDEEDTDDTNDDSVTSSNEEKRDEE